MTMSILSKSCVLVLRMVGDISYIKIMNFLNNFFLWKTTHIFTIKKQTKKTFYTVFPFPDITNTPVTFTTIFFWDSNHKFEDQVKYIFVPEACLLRSLLGQKWRVKDTDQEKHGFHIYVFLIWWTHKMQPKNLKEFNKDKGYRSTDERKKTGKN